MEFHMSMVVPVSPAVLWNTLIDVSSISACIPGCESVDEIERLETYKAILKQKIGPFKVEIPADIVVDSMTEPSHIRTRATGRDKFTGTRVAVVLDVTVTKAECLASTFAVDATVDVQGRLASLGFSIIKRRVDQNFEEFEAKIQDLLVTSCDSNGSIDAQSGADVLDKMDEGQILRTYDRDVLGTTELRQANIRGFRAWLYRCRNLFARFFSKLKLSRAAATRFEKDNAG